MEDLLAACFCVFCVCVSVCMCACVWVTLPGEAAMVRLCQSRSSQRPPQRPPESGLGHLRRSSVGGPLVAQQLVPHGWFVPLGPYHGAYAYQLVYHWYLVPYHWYQC
jgi:hypothetical protein